MSEEICEIMSSSVPMDMSDNSLQYVLKYINLRFLLELARGNERISRIVKCILSQRYSNQLVFGYHNSQRKCCNNNLAVNDLNIALQLLQCFGKKIKQLSYTFKEKHEFNSYPWNSNLLYSIEYCAKSLETFELNGFQTVLPSDFKVRFENVKNLYIEDCIFNYLNGDSLRDQFPKMTNLSIVYNWLGDSDKKFCDRVFGEGIKDASPTNFYERMTKTFQFVEKHFPFLESLHVGVSSGNETYQVELLKESLFNTLSLNPQIKCLDISATKYQFLSLDDLQRVSSHLQNLETLKLVVNQMSFRNQNIYLPNLKCLNFTWGNCSLAAVRFGSDKLQKMLLTSNRLLNEEEYAFIDKHPALIDISIDYIGSRKKVDLHRLAKGLPKLKQLHFGWYVMADVDDVMKSLDELKSLMEIQFFQENPKIIEENSKFWKFCMDNQWSLSTAWDDYFNSNSVTLKRK